MSDPFLLLVISEAVFISDITYVTNHALVYHTSAAPIAPGICCSIALMMWARGKADPWCPQVISVLLGCLGPTAILVTSRQKHLDTEALCRSQCVCRSYYLRRRTALSKALRLVLLAIIFQVPAITARTVRPKTKP